MDSSIYTRSRAAQLAQMQLIAITPLLQNARLIMLTDALPKVFRTAQQEVVAQEAAAALAQSILMLEHDLKKVICGDGRMAPCKGLSENHPAPSSGAEPGI